MSDQGWNTNEVQIAHLLARIARAETEPRRLGDVPVGELKCQLIALIDANR